MSSLLEHKSIVVAWRLPASCWNQKHVVMEWAAQKGAHPERHLLTCREWAVPGHRVDSDSARYLPVIHIPHSICTTTTQTGRAAHNGSQQLPTARPALFPFLPQGSVSVARRYLLILESTCVMQIRIMSTGPFSLLPSLCFRHFLWRHYSWTYCKVMNHEI